MVECTRRAAARPAAPTANRICRPWPDADPIAIKPPFDAVAGRRPNRRRRTIAPTASSGKKSAFLKPHDEKTVKSGQPRRGSGQVEGQRSDGAGRGDRLANAADL